MASKNEILQRVRQGRQRKEPISVEALGGETVEASPLTADQLTEIQKLESEGQKTVVDASQSDSSGQMNVDMPKTTEGRYRAGILAVRYGCGWAEDEVRELPKDAIIELSDKIQELDVFEDKEVKKSGSE